MTTKLKKKHFLNLFLFLFVCFFLFQSDDEENPIGTSRLTTLAHQSWKNLDWIMFFEKTKMKEEFQKTFLRLYFSFLKLFFSFFFLEVLEHSRNRGSWFQCLAFGFFKITQFSIQTSKKIKILFAQAIFSIFSRLNSLFSFCYLKKKELFVDLLHDPLRAKSSSSQCNESSKSNSLFPFCAVCNNYWILHAVLLNV